MQSYCDERFTGIEVAGWETLVDVAAGQHGDFFFPAYGQVWFDQWNNDAKKFTSPFGRMFNELLPVFLGAKEYDHLSFRYNSHSEPLDPTLNANEFISESVELADWLVDTGLFNSIPLANDPSCREFILCAFWIIRMGCIVIPLCAGIENFIKSGSLRSYCSPRSV